MGYLSSDPNDAALLEQNGQSGNDTVPAASGLEGLGTAVEQGIAGIGTSLSHVGEDLLANAGAPAYARLGTTAQITDPNLGDTTATHLNPEGFHQTIEDSGFGKGRKNLEDWIASNKQYEGPGAQMVGSLVQGIGTFGIGAVAGGPFGAAALMGGTAADETYREDKAAGVDARTASEGALVSGALNAAGAAVPFKLGSLFTRVFGSAAINEGLGVAGRGAQHAILAANGYAGMASAQQPFDEQQMTADALLGVVMGFGVHVAEVGSPFIKSTLAKAVMPTQADAARSVKDTGHVESLSPGIAIDPIAAKTHEDVFARTAADIASGKQPHVTDAEAKTILNGVIDDPERDAQVRATVDALAEDPHVQLEDEMSPLIADALSAVNAQPVGETTPSELPTGSPSSYRTLDEMAADAHRAKVLDLAAKNGFTPEQAQELETVLFQPPGRDNVVPSMYDKYQHEPLIQSLIDHAKATGETVHYFEGDSRGLTARNKTLGRVEANDSLREDAEALLHEGGRIGHVTGVRHGGDEYAGGIIGAQDDATVDAALRRADERAKAAAAARGIDIGEQMGVRTAFVQIHGNERVRDVTSALGKEIERLKEAEKNDTGQAQATGARQNVGSPAKEVAGGAVQAEGRQGAVSEDVNAALRDRLEAKDPGQLIDLPDGTRATVAQIAARQREEVANANLDQKLMDAAVSCFASTGGIE